MGRGKQERRKKKTKEKKKGRRCDVMRCDETKQEKEQTDAYQNKEHAHTRETNRTREELNNN